MTSPPSPPPMPSVAGEKVTHVHVQVPGALIHAASAGPEDGPTIVLLHGWPQNWWIWRDVIPGLSEAGWRCVALDLRGCGWSSAPTVGYLKEQLCSDVVAVLDHLGVDRFTIAGHDWGGWTAQLVAIDQRDRVEGVTLLNIASLWMPRGVAARRLHRFLYQPLVAAPGLGPLVQRNSAFWKVVQQAGVPADAIGVYRSTLARPAHSAAGSRFYREFLRHELVPIARGRYDDARIEAPVTALMGLDDPVISPAMLAGLSDHALSFVVEEVEGCGHFIVDQRPDAVVAHLLTHHGRPSGSS